MTKKRPNDPRGDTKKECLRACKRLEVFWMFQGYDNVKAWPQKMEFVDCYKKHHVCYIVKSNLTNGVPVGYKPLVPISEHIMCR